MANPDELGLIQMKEQIQMLGSSTEKYGDPTLERFLIAKSKDPKKAAKMFVEWQQWRKSFVPLGFIPDSEVLPQLECKNIFILKGLSKTGHAVLMVDSGKHSPVKDQNQFKKFAVHIYDKGIASGIKGKEIGNEKFIEIMDLKTLSYKNVDTRAFISGIQILQNYYPERLAKLYLINIPWFFKSVWKLITPFIEKELLNKIMMVSNEKEKKQFIEEVGIEVLPMELGGNAKLVPIQDVQVPQLEC
uniref:CRAL-TRIO domain-containing protein YKL091C-like n=1 Tax=Erigeron canadensis TaxID=72917 RepID=UPI001CB8B1E8|nr:CRAL-TRIO domain-containing protein YKL091C-like [Erigeron canadensis]